MTRLLSSVCAAAVAVAVFTPVRAQPARTASATPLADVSQRPDLTVETRGAKVEPLLQGLRQQGVWVVRLVGWPELLLPAPLRYRTVKASELIEAVAGYRGLAVSWWQGREVIAVLHRPTEAAYLQSLLVDLASADEGRRREGSWRAGWERDARLVPALVELARETGQESSRLARRTLARIGWEAALALREADTLRLLERDFDPVRFHLERVGEALAKVSGPEAIGLVRKLVDAGDCSALPALGRMRTEAAMALLEDVVAGKDRCPSEALLALELAGSPRSRELLRERFLRNTTGRGTEAFAALARMWGKDSLEFLKQELDKGNRLGAIVALGQVGGPEAFALLDQAVRDMRIDRHEDAHPALEAVRNLGRVAGRTPAVRAQALATLEKTFDQHGWVYDENLKERVIEALVEIGPDALPVLMRIIRTKAVMHRSGSYWPVESAIVKALGELGGPGTWEMVLQAGSTPEVATAYLAALALSGRDASAQVLALLRSEVSVNLEPAMFVFECSQAVRILQAFAESDSAYYARQLRQTLVALGGDIPGEKLRVMASGADPYARAEVPDLLQGLHGGATPDLLLELLPSLAVDPHWPVRGATARISGRLPEEQAYSLLGRFANDEHGNVRDSSYRELALVGGEPARRVLQARVRVSRLPEHEQASLASAILVLDMDNVAAALRDVYLGRTGLVHYVIEASRSGWQSAKAQMIFPKVLELMRESLDDPDGATAARAVRFLARHASHPIAREILRRLYLSPSDAHAKLGRLALVSMGIERGVDFLKQLLPSLGAEDRQALISLVRSQDDLLAPMLERALAIEPARLIKAVEGNDLASARMLLGLGADANAWCNTRGRTVLMVAAERGLLAMVRLLVENQANIHRKEQSTRMTALAYAVRRGRRDVAAHLLRQGADANAVVRVRGEPDSSLLALCLRRKDSAMARLLMAHGARSDE